MLLVASIYCSENVDAICDGAGSVNLINVKELNIITMTEKDDILFY